MKKHAGEGAVSPARSLRVSMTNAEKHLWQALRSRQMDGHQFRRQVPIGRYIVDFACHEMKLIIEIDGGQHDPKQQHEANRTAILQGDGYGVLRFRDNDVLANRDGVLVVIAEALQRRHPRPTLPHRGGGLCNPMDLALEAARTAALAGEIPVGAVLIDGPTGHVLAVAGNRTVADSDPTAHAEILAIRQACAEAGSARLPEADLYVTLEPCPMCAGAIAQARLRRVYFGAYDPKGGAVEHGVRLFDQASCHHRPDVYGGLQETEAAAQLRDFFLARR